MWTSPLLKRPQKLNSTCLSASTSIQLKISPRALAILLEFAVVLLTIMETTLRILSWRNPKIINKGSTTQFQRLPTKSYSELELLSLQWDRLLSWQQLPVPSDLDVPIKPNYFKYRINLSLIKWFQNSILSFFIIQEVNNY